MQPTNSVSLKRPLLLDLFSTNQREKRATAFCCQPLRRPANMALNRPNSSGGRTMKDSVYEPPQRGFNNNFNKRMSKDDMFFSSPQQSRNAYFAGTDKRMSRDDMFFNNSRRSRNPYFAGTDKRISRDDIYIRSKMAAMSQFHIPAHGSTITPQQSPDYPVLQEVTIPIRMNTPESMTSGEIPIGMALGSPTTHLPPDHSATHLPLNHSSTHLSQVQSTTYIPPDQSRWQAQFPPGSPQVSMVPETSPVASVPNGSLQRKKTGRRKLFGLFGGGKKSAEPQALTKDSPAPVSTENSTGSRVPARSNTQSERKTPKHKPLISRSNTLPTDQEEELVAQPGTAGLPNARGRPSEPIARQGNAYQRGDAVPRMPPVPSLLNVQIPDTKLERYSVMFSDVLNPSGTNPGGTNHDTSVPLLARRQATLERLKPINEAIDAEQKRKDMSRPRRATSPQPQPTPRLSVFPSPTPNRTQPPVMDTPTSVSRVARSNTSPGRLPSPTNASFDIRRGPVPTRTTSRNLAVPNPFGMHPSSSTGVSPPIYPTDTSFHFGGDQQAGPILASPITLEPNEEIIIAQPLKPTLHEPQWRMVSPSTSSPLGLASSSSSTATTDAASGQHARSASMASTSTHMTKPSTDSSSTTNTAKFNEADAAFQNAVEVSIARQISISRQQRQLLRPLQTRGPLPAGAGAGASPRSAVTASASGGAITSPLGVTVVKESSPNNRLGKTEPIKEIQSSTPTLVHAWDSPIKQENRKSSWVVLETE